MLERFKEELEKLNLPKDKFAIFGSGPLVIRGIRESQDIDILVKAELWEELEKKYPKEKEDLIKIGNIEIFKDWKPWFEDKNKLIDDSDIIKGFRFVKLKYTIKWKELYNREKDREDIRLIKKYLKANTKT